MRPLRSLLVYLAAIFFLGAVLAPWLYWLAQWSARNIAGLEGLAKMPFTRCLDRSLQLVALAGLWPFLRSLGARSWADVGLTAGRERWRGVATGFSLGLGFVVFLGLLALLGGARRIELDDTGAELLASLLTAGLSALVVGVLEELLFRGGLFGALRRVHPWTVALSVSSIVYALAHFLQKARPPSVVTWTSGLELLSQMGRGFAELDRLMPGFLILTGAGMMLGLAYHRTGSLLFSIGLHAGWVFGIKSVGLFTGQVPGAAVRIWGTKNLVDGWLALVFIVVVFIWMWMAGWKQRKSPDAR